MFLSPVLSEYPGAKEICEYVEYYNKHMHELCVHDGTWRTYNCCRGTINFGNNIFYNGEHYLSQTDIYTYRNAKFFIRQALRRVKQVQRMKTI